MQGAVRACRGRKREGLGAMAPGGGIAPEDMRGRDSGRGETTRGMEETTWRNQGRRIPMPQRKHIRANRANRANICPSYSLSF
jgi:hypothetical protein